MGHKPMKPHNRFKVGDNVVHSAYGVGHIVQVEKKQFSKDEVRYYYKVILTQLTLWVPIEEEASLELRIATAKRDLAQYRKLLQSRPASPSEDPAQRHKNLNSRLKEGSFPSDV